MLFLENNIDENYNAVNCFDQCIKYSTVQVLVFEMRVFYLRVLLLLQRNEELIRVNFLWNEVFIILLTAPFTFV